MAALEGWLPPSRENWELISYGFQFFPLVTIFQWTISWYGMGKTSVTSPFNIPGKAGWLTMEAPGFLTLLYIMFTLPEKEGISDLPWENKLLAGLFTVHYLYRAVLFPLAQPTMSPIHLLVWLFGLAFQFLNAISIGGWLAAYGPTTAAAWDNHETSFIASARMELGLMIWAIGFLLTIFHDDELREIRRAALRHQRRLAAEAAAQDDSTGKAKAGVRGVDKVYLIPKNGAFKWILFPHYFFEWFEWTGFWIMGGSSFVPGRTFVLNEVSTMLPRAVQGKRWYVEKFGKERVGARKAIIPGIL